MARAFTERQGADVLNGSWRTCFISAPSLASCFGLEIVGVAFAATVSKLSAGWRLGVEVVPRHVHCARSGRLGKVARKRETFRSRFRRWWRFCRRSWRRRCWRRRCWRRRSGDARVFDAFEWRLGDEQIVHDDIASSAAALPPFNPNLKRSWVRCH